MKFKEGTHKLIRLKKTAKHIVKMPVLVVNSILLSVVYIIGVGFTSMIAKLVGKHFLDLKSPKKDTYWSNLDLKKKPINKYYRQF